MDEKLWLFHYSLVCSGVYFFSKTNWDTKLKIAHQLLNCIICVFIFTFTSGFIIVTSDAIARIEGICIWITGVIADMSVAITLVFRKQFRTFLEEMAFKDAILDMPFVQHVMNTPYHDGSLKKLRDLVVESQQNWMKYSTLLLKAYTFNVMSTVVLYICDSIIRMIMRDEESLRILSFEMWYPWKLDDFNVYIATFIFEAYAGFLSGIVYPSIQSTIALLMGQIIRQLRILTFILLHLDELVVELTQTRDERWQMNCTSVLSQCVDHYVMIKRFSNRLNVICQPFYLALILNAIVLVCVCSVKIAITNKLSPELIKYYMHECFFILMVLVFCLLGQQVENECKNLQSVVMEKWYIFGRQHKKNVLIFSMALSQSIPIYIFGTIPLTLPTFTWFIKTGMSFFTLIMSVIDG